MSKYNILKSFPFSKDGINRIQAEAGETIKIPENLVDGLTAAGFIEPAGKKDKAGKKSKKKDAGAAPEKKMLNPADENKGGPEEAIAAARVEYKDHFGKKAHYSWNYDVILKKISDDKAENEG